MIINEHNVLFSNKNCYDQYIHVIDSSQSNSWSRIQQPIPCRGQFRSHTHEVEFPGLSNAPKCSTKPFVMDLQKLMDLLLNYDMRLNQIYSTKERSKIVFLMTLTKAFRY